MRKRAFFSNLLLICSVDAVAGVCAGLSTLGGFVRAAACCGRVGVLTLGDAATGTGWIGIISTLFICVANVSNAFLTGSPASRLGVVVDGGCVSMVMISVAACLRKSSNFICGNGTVAGKNVTVSQSLTSLVRGK